jgi:hypothetical protein
VLVECALTCDSVQVAESDGKSGHRERNYRRVCLWLATPQCPALSDVMVAQLSVESGFPPECGSYFPPSPSNVLVMLLYGVCSFSIESNSWSAGQPLCSRWKRSSSSDFSRSSRVTSATSICCRDRAFEPVENHLHRWQTVLLRSASWTSTSGGTVASPVALLL